MDSVIANTSTAGLIVLLIPILVIAAAVNANTSINIANTAVPVEIGAIATNASAIRLIRTTVNKLLLILLFLLVLV